MGNNNSNLNSEKKNSSNNLKTNIPTNSNNTLKFDEEKDYVKIFNIITNLSNDIFDYYDENFLNEEFCNKISFVYENKLKKLKLNVLRNIQSNIDNSSNKELELVLKYEPTEDENL